MDGHASIRWQWVLSLGIAAVLAAPTCLAQEAVAGPDAETEPAGDDIMQPANGQPRSAFGQVMSLLVTALQRNAETPGITPPTDDAAPQATAPNAPNAPARNIQVSAKFQLDAPKAAEETPLAATTALE